MPKNKPHKGLLKRVKVTKTGKVRHRSAFHSHLSSHKSGKRLRQLRGDPYISNAEIKRAEKLLFRRLRGRSQPTSKEFDLLPRLAGGVVHTQVRRD